MASPFSPTLEERPGSDPSRPHHDLRIPSRVPSRLLSQAVLSSSQQSTSTTLPVAVQIASLHRAAEVARFDWRASHADQQWLLELTISPQRGGAPRNRYPLISTAAASSSSNAPRSAFSSSSPASTSARMPRVSQRDDSSRFFSSSLEAYISAARDISQPDTSSDAPDYDPTLETPSSSESDNTEDEVIATTLRSSQDSRRTTGSGGEAEFSSAMYQRIAEDVAAESQVWDRMVDDLAIGAGLHGRISQPPMGYSPYSRGISGGIAASMLALSAAVPRPEPNTSGRDPRRAGGSSTSRLLPHPIWARRYPGAAGEWLRGELARRASASARQHQIDARRSTSPRTQSAQRAAAAPSTGSPETALPSSSPWRILQFPSLDPRTRERPAAQQMQGDDQAAAAVSSDAAGVNSLSVPSNATALAPTPPPVAIIESGTPSRAILDNSSAARQRAGQVVARMAAELRERNAVAAATASSTSDDIRGQSRSLRGGMEYIRRLRALDAADGRRSARRVTTQAEEYGRWNDRFEEPASPPRMHEVFPWYHPPSQVDTLSDMMADADVSDVLSSEADHSFDPDGSHIAQSTHADTIASQLVVNSDPNGDHLDADDNRDHLLRRRLIRASTGTTSAAQRHRNRSALVISSEDSEDRMNDIVPANAAEGWTVIDARPSSPVRRTRDEGSQNVTTWFRGPAMSTSPSLMEEEEGDSYVRAAPPGNQNSTAIPRRHSGTTTVNPHSVGLLPMYAQRGQGRSPTAPVRRPEYASTIRGDASAFGLRSLRRSMREETPSPELMQDGLGGSLSGSLPQSTDREPGFSEAIARTRHLSNIGAQLEEEFRVRQGELQQREDHLRSEVARRRLELDELRRQQGRIGRVIERNRSEVGEEDDDPERHSDVESGEGGDSPAGTTQGDGRTGPLTRQPSMGSASLVRRNAVRESLLRAPRPSSEYDAAFGTSGIR